MPRDSNLTFPSSLSLLAYKPMMTPSSGRKAQMPANKQNHLHFREENIGKEFSKTVT